MAEPAKPKTQTTTRAAAAAAAPAQPAEAAEPTVVYRKKKKKKRKYTQGLKDVQRLQRGAVRATDRVADAVAAGMADFRKRNNKSSRKRRDGAIVDAFDNWTRAASKTIQRSADAPFDLTRGIRTRRLVRQARVLAELVPNPFFPFLR